MGATVCEAVADADGLDLVAAVDPVAAGRLLGEVAGARGATLSGVPALLEVAADATELVPETIDVAVDFTVAPAAMANLRWCASSGVHAVAGTTGLQEEERADLARLFGDPAGPHCVLAANFSIGAVLMMRCAELCAPYLSGVEIIELHHAAKRDAPSGTSLETLRRIDEARRAHPESGRFTADPTQLVALEGVRGGLGASGVRVHSIRLPGFVAHQEVIFGSPGETLTIRHDSTDRVSFMPGVLLAVEKVASTPGLTLGLEPLLGL